MRPLDLLKVGVDLPGAEQIVEVLCCFGLLEGEYPLDDDEDDHSH